jgi:hypothetical protein
MHTVCVRACEQTHLRKLALTNLKVKEYQCLEHGIKKEFFTEEKLSNFFVGSFEDIIQDGFCSYYPYYKHP